jgi:hypothetical protein
MNRRSLLVQGGAVCCAVLFALMGSPKAARLLVSTVTIEVLSVDRLSSSRQIYANGQPFETTKYVATARIQKVLRTDHGLSPDAVIEIHYDRRDPPMPGPLDHVLKVGDTATLAVSGGGHTFTWRY